jgi:DNA-3-methyladenine glycosylase II
MAISTFGDHNYQSLCDKLCKRDKRLKAIIQQYGYPPMWTRPIGFATLVHIILEQQVSLASAQAAVDRLKNRLSEITPEGILSLTDEELKACALSRQKISYVRHLATAVRDETIDLDALSLLSNEEIKTRLTAIKGIGHWTTEVYLMMCLQRSDLLPLGDVAIMNTIRELYGVPNETSKEEILMLTKHWAPYQTIASFILWHHYLSKRRRS